VNQCASKRYAQQLCIRYVSGLRNQTFFSFNHFRKPCNHPICMPQWRFEKVASKDSSYTSRWAWLIVSGLPVTWEEWRGEAKGKSSVYLHTTKFNQPDQTSAQTWTMMFVRKFLRHAARIPNRTPSTQITEDITSRPMTTDHSPGQLRACRRVRTDHGKASPFWSNRRGGGHD
jgi:hypothetical protein